MRALVARIALAALALGVAATDALAAPPEIAATALVAKPGALLQPTIVRIDGTWPTSCVPRLEKSRLDGTSLDVVARVDEAGCTVRATPFRLAVSTSASGGPMLLAPTVYRVTLFTHRGKEAPAVAAFALLDRSTRPIAPESGFWWSVADPAAGAALPATGLSIERQDDRIAVTLYGFDRTGASTWYFGSATLTGRTAHVNLSRLANGNEAFDEPTVAPTIDAGPTLDLAFTGPARTTAWLSRRSGFADDAPLEVRALAFGRLAFDASEAGSAWRGTWVLLREDTADARRLDFAQLSTSDGDGFRLADTAQGVTLDCRVDADKTPTACTLRGGDGREITRFDAIGLDRLEGLDADGARVRLVRLPN